MRSATWALGVRGLPTGLVERIQRRFSHPRRMWPQVATTGGNIKERPAGLITRKVKHRKTNFTTELCSMRLKCTSHAGRKGILLTYCPIVSNNGCACNTLCCADCIHDHLHNTYGKDNIPPHAVSTYSATVMQTSTHVTTNAASSSGQHSHNDDGDGSGNGGKPPRPPKNNNRNQNSMNTIRRIRPRTSRR